MSILCESVFYWTIALLDNPDVIIADNLTVFSTQDNSIFQDNPFSQDSQFKIALRKLVKEKFHRITPNGFWPIVYEHRLCSDGKLKE